MFEKRVLKRGSHDGYTLWFSKSAKRPRGKIELVSNHRNEMPARLVSSTISGWKGNDNVQNVRQQDVSGFNNSWLIYTDRGGQQQCSSCSVLPLCRLTLPFKATAMMSSIDDQTARYQHSGEILCSFHQNGHTRDEVYNQNKRNKCTPIFYPLQAPTCG